MLNTIEDSISSLSLYPYILSFIFVPLNVLMILLSLSLSFLLYLKYNKLPKMSIIIIKGITTYLIIFLILSPFILYNTICIYSKEKDLLYI